MKQLFIRLREEDYKTVRRESEKRNISMAEYIRLIIQSLADEKSNSGIWGSDKEGGLGNRKEATAKLLLSSLPTHKRMKICQQILRRDKRKGQLEPYVEGILSKNPKAKAEEIYKALSETFGVPLTPNIRKMIRRVKERFRKRRQN
jgi:hypothetical protein